MFSSDNENLVKLRNGLPNKDATILHVDFGDGEVYYTLSNIKGIPTGLIYAVNINYDNDCVKVLDDPWSGRTVNEVSELRIVINQMHENSIAQYDKNIEGYCKIRTCVDCNTTFAKAMGPTLRCNKCRTVAAREGKPVLCSECKVVDPDKHGCIANTGMCSGCCESSDY